MSAQKFLDHAQIEAFHHDLFVTDQVRDFATLAGALAGPGHGTVVDVGGGCGFFARAIRDTTGARVRVLDSDEPSLEVARGAGVEAVKGDALAPQPQGDEGIVCFNLILHHLVGAGERRTRELQQRALAAWHGRVPAIFVNEYIYESYLLRDVSARLIYLVTSSRLLSAIAKAISRVAPTLKANTFGVGVRFRSSAAWRAMFASLGYDVVGSTVGVEEDVSGARRLLLIKSCRRDSFLLRPRVTSGAPQG